MAYFQLVDIIQELNSYAMGDTVNTGDTGRRFGYEEDIGAGILYGEDQDKTGIGVSFR
jgi:hypothetical protein